MSAIRYLEEDVLDVPFFLVLTTGRGVVTIPLPVGEQSDIGRDPACAIVVPDGSVSRVHARIHRNGDAVAIEDLGSRNGTFVDDRQLSPGERVAIADRHIRIGEVELELERAPLVSESTCTSTRAAPPIVLDPKMRELYTQLETVAKSTLAVILLGETGVGKDVAAHFIHDASSRSRAPFVALNCAAFPESVLEAELFGYEKGAFTGATNAKPGLFEAADHGTVYLDEIGDMPLATQATLLRVLESGEVRPLGATKSKKVDVRLVAASNHDLEARCAAGTFRRDLWFRLAGFVATIPPLRERPSEILPLARAIALAFSERTKIAFAGFTADAEGMLATRAWPGNVRELRNVVERAVVLGRGNQVDANTLATDEASSPSASPNVSWKDRQNEVEKARIVSALEETGGNQTQAAKLLGMPRRTLVHKLGVYGIARPRKHG